MCDSERPAVTQLVNGGPSPPLQFQSRAPGLPMAAGDMQGTLLWSAVRAAA